MHSTGSFYCNYLTLNTPEFQTVLVYVFNSNKHTSGEDAWVHKRSHAKVGQCEEEDHDIVDGNGRRETLGQPRTTTIRERRRGRQSEVETQTTVTQIFPADKSHVEREIM